MIPYVMNFCWYILFKTKAAICSYTSVSSFLA